MDILLMKRKGLTQREIARKLGISRNTVKKYIEHQGYPEPDVNGNAIVYQKWE